MWNLRSLFLYGDIGENFDSTSIPFIEAAGGSTARVAVLGIGGPTWEGYFIRVFQDRWTRFGVQEVIPVLPDEHMRINDETRDKLNQCSGLLICGGDTREYYKVCVEDSDMRKTIRSLYHRGIPIAGVSAGAFSTSPCTIWGNVVTSNENEFAIRSTFNSPTEKHELVTGVGIRLLTHCLVEPHFSEYGGFSRLIASMEQTSTSIGLGLDEPICLRIIDETRVTVYGRGRVYYITKLRELEFNTKVYQPGQDFCIPNLR